MDQILDLPSQHYHELYVPWKHVSTWESSDEFIYPVIAYSQAMAINTPEPDCTSFAVW